MEGFRQMQAYDCLVCGRVTSSSKSALALAWEESIDLSEVFALRV